jgi:hypothetical protein
MIVALGSVKSSHVFELIRRRSREGQPRATDQKLVSHKTIS